MRHWWYLIVATIGVCHSFVILMVRQHRLNVHFVLGDKGSHYNTPVARFIDLQQKGLSFTNIKEAFSVEALSKDFYNKLYNWYLWALSEDINVTFPNNPNTEKDDRENINVKLIRMITRCSSCGSLNRKDWCLTVSLTRNS